MSIAPRDAAKSSGANAPDEAVVEALTNAGVEIEGVTPAHAKSNNPIVRIIEFITGAAGVLACLLLVAATIVVCQMIFVRAVLGWNTIWQTDFTIYSATAAIFIGAPYVLAQKGHVGVDVIPMMLKGSARRWIDRVNLLLGFTFCACMLYASWHYFYEALTEGWRTETLWAIPLWIPVLPLVIGFALLCLQYVAELIKLEEGTR